MIARLLFIGLLLSSQVLAQSEDDAFTRGQQAVARYQFDDAIRAFYHCHQQDPNRHDCLRQLAWCHQQMGNSRDARIYYQALIHADSLDPSSWLSLGIVEEQNGGLEEAHKAFARAVAIDSTNAYFLKKLGQVSIQLGRVPEAIEAFQLSLIRNSRDLETTSALAEAMIQMDALENARTAIEEGLALNRKYRPLLRLGIRISNRQENPNQTITYGEALFETGDSSLYALTLIGHAYFKLDSLSRALFLLDRACSEDRATDLAHYYYALALDASGQSTQAVDQMKRAIEKGQSDYLHLFWEQTGRLYLLRKQYKAAIEAYQAAERIHSNPENVFQIGRAYDQWYKDKEPAMRYYQMYMDSRHPQFAEYASQRLQLLRSERHQKVKQ